MKKYMNKATAKRAAANLIVTMSLIVGMYADPKTDINEKINTWGGSLWDIAQVLLKWGGIVSFVCLGIYLYFTNDETGAKKAKIGMAVAFLAALIGTMAKSFVGIFS